MLARKGLVASHVNASTVCVKIGESVVQVRWNSLEYSIESMRLAARTSALQDDLVELVASNVLGPPSARLGVAANGSHADTDVVSVSTVAGVLGKLNDARVQEREAVQRHEATARRRGGVNSGDSHRAFLSAPSRGLAVASETACTVAIAESYYHDILKGIIQAEDEVILYQAIFIQLHTECPILMSESWKEANVIPPSAPIPKLGFWGVVERLVAHDPVLVALISDAGCSSLSPLELYSHRLNFAATLPRPILEKLFSTLEVRKWSRIVSNLLDRQRINLGYRLS